MKIRRNLEVIVAGDANCDLILTDVPPLELDKEKLAGDMNLLLGGSSTITAFNLARLGARVGFAGVLGGDMFGTYVEEKLRWAGVDLGGLIRRPRMKTGLTIWLNTGTRRAGVTYPGTIAALKGRDVSSDYLARARHLHVGAYFFLENLHPGAPALFRRARKLGLTTSLDGNFDPTEKWDSNIWKVLAHTDIFFPNEDEALRMTRKPDVREAARELGRLARIVAVKRGGDGALVHSAEGTFEVPAVPAKVVETTGAGDSFNAGFLAAFVKGAPLEECARAGAAAGARAVTRPGGTTAFE